MAGVRTSLLLFAGSVDFPREERRDRATRCAKTGHELQARLPYHACVNTRIEHPIIAINGLLSLDKEPAVRLANRYADAVLKAGGIPIVIPPVGGPVDVDRLLQHVDGLLLSGGDDFDTERLGLGATHPAADPTPTAKQDFDFMLVQRALERRMPVLGVCYGMQVLGLAEGATLHQHLPEDRPDGRTHSGGVEHDVDVEPGTKLARLLGVERLPVLSRHHQALCTVQPPWKVCAVDDEGLIEAIERADHPFAVGVQWHPELGPEGSRHDRLFRGLVGAAALALAEHLGT
ncbi:MAG: putative glutamine amidotransferase [Chlamydiales bacterium]